MSLELRFSNQSQDELNEIWDYIADDNLSAADRMVDRIISTCQSFTLTPELGRSRAEFRAGLRSFPVGNYMIFYRVGPESIDILRILHGARNIEDLLASSTDETFD